jgi:hypothetical protein
LVPGWPAHKSSSSSSSFTSCRAVWASVTSAVVFARAQPRLARLGMVAGGLFAGFLYGAVVGPC